LLVVVVFFFGLLVERRSWDLWGVFCFFLFFWVCWGGEDTEEGMKEEEGGVEKGIGSCGWEVVAVVSQRIKVLNFFQ
jgi:hypothetical protein